MTASESRRHPASFRDPQGYVFEAEGALYRAVSVSGEDDFRALIKTGLYDELVAEDLLIAHTDLGPGVFGCAPYCRVLRPDRVPLISYASEWTFAQLKIAALLTLDVQIRALRLGMSLKDASSFNVQFVGAKAIFIDTSSFTQSAGDGPWVAYRQFCEHFLAPLALRAYRGPIENFLSMTSVDGLPLSIASALLPRRSWCRMGLLTHLHLHSRAGSIAGTLANRKRTAAMRRTPGFALRLAESLRSAVQALTIPSESVSDWVAYRNESSYSESALATKVAFVEQCIAQVKPRRALDLGANDGMFTGLLAGSGVAVTAVESDGPCCEEIFQMACRSWPSLVNTMRVDLANPTPSFGWAGNERSSFQERAGCELVLALALIHHLSISRNVPYGLIAEFFSQLAPYLVVEHVPPNDPMAVSLLAARTGITDAESTYGEGAFLCAFQAHFDVLQRSEPLAGGRILFLMRRRGELN